jgi:hypothetical protein
MFAPQGSAPTWQPGVLRRLTREAVDVIPAGKVICSDGCGEEIEGAKGKPAGLWYSARNEFTGGDVRAVMLPGRVPGLGLAHRARLGPRLTAARLRALPALYQAAAILKMPKLADTGYLGAGFSQWPI